MIGNTTPCFVAKSSYIKYPLTSKNSLTILLTIENNVLSKAPGWWKMWAAGLSFTKAS
jgi:hypothetical protein